ncbi:MAG: hypothetical protein IKM29_05650 [Clostridia bacterium]|nr:hypothetical protein [Clostridia bacterium]
MKKVLCLILAACMCLSLCACGFLSSDEGDSIFKQVDLEELVPSYMVDSVDELYCIHYDSDYEFDNDTGIELPINGIVYVVGYKNGEYDVVTCKFTRKKIESFDCEALLKSVEEDGMTSPAYWKLKFANECLEGAMESMVSLAEGATEIEYNKWYCYYPEEIEALKNGDRLPEITTGSAAGAADADKNDVDAPVADAPAAAATEAPAVEAPAEAPAN